MDLYCFFFFLSWTVLSNENAIKKSEEYNYIKPYTGNGLFTALGEVFYIFTSI